MDKRQEARIKMSRTVSGILKGFQEIVSGTPGLNAAHIELDHLIAETQRHNQGQLQDGTDLTTRKNEARLALTTGMLKVGTALAAFATAKPDPELNTFRFKYKLTENQLQKKRDMQLFTLAYAIYGDALAHAASLEPFATADDVDALKGLADHFKAALPLKRAQLSKSVLSTRNLEEAVGQIDHLLGETIDILVRPWEFKEPDFYKAYRNARMIVDAGARKSKKPESKAAEVAEK